MSDDEKAERLRAMARAEGVDAIALRISPAGALFMQHVAAALTQDPPPKAVALVTLSEVAAGMVPALVRAATPSQLLGMAHTLIIQAERDIQGGDACDCADCRAVGESIAAAKVALSAAVTPAPFTAENDRRH